MTDTDPQPPPGRPQRRQGFLARLLLGGLLALVLFGAYFLIEQRYRLENEGTVLAGADAAQRLVASELKAMGPLNLRGGELYAGSVYLGGPKGLELVDRIKAITGFGCTLFSGSKRVATTATTTDGDGRVSRAINTEASEEVQAQTLRGGAVFRGTAYTLGRHWTIIYAPIRVAGAVVGMVATYREHDALLSQMSPFRLLLAGTLLFLFILVLLLMSRLDRWRARLVAQSVTLDSHRRQLALQQTLVETQAHFKAVLDSAVDGIITIDESGRIESANPAAERLFGYDAGGLTGQPFQFLMRPDDALNQTLLGSEDSGRQVLLGQRKDGSTLPLEVSLSEFDVGGRHRFTGFVRDVTERQKIRRSLKRSHSEAMAGARAKSEFLATMSHEIRTPMNGVIGMVNLLLEEELGVEQRELAEHIRQSAQSLVTILDDVLNISKLRSGTLVLEQLQFDMLELVEEVLVIHHEAAQRKGVQLLVTATGDLHRVVRGDSDRVRQVINNLVSNATKFTHSGHVRIHLSSRVVALRTVELEVKVEDTGIGIARDKLERVFERFEQAEGSTQHRFGGTGLGLAISRELARLMGGEVSASSRLGEGATFTFTARLLTATTSTSHDPVAERADGLRALLALPGRVEREQVMGYLTSFGVLCTAATSAKELRLLTAAAGNRGAFDLIIADRSIVGRDWPVLMESLAEADRRLATLMVCRRGERFTPSQLNAINVQRLIRRPIRLSRLLGHITTIDVDSSAVAALDTDRTEARPETPASMKFKGRVLVAEDNLTNQRVAVVMVSKLGCDVTVANNGQEAVTLLREQPFDLVFMDCQMPKMDGYEATREVRSWGGDYVTLPIIALTANVMPEDRERCLLAGMNAHMSKPVTREDFRDTLARWLPDEARRATG